MMKNTYMSDDFFFLENTISDILYETNTNVAVFFRWQKKYGGPIADIFTSIVCPWT